jgi:hypothetical protein
MEPVDQRKTNVFLLATEYHFLLAMSIVDEFFPADRYFNKLFFLGKRLSDVDITKLPDNFSASMLIFETENFFKHRVHHEILNTPVENLFVVNAYRSPETYILSVVPPSTTTHLMQDGALFYNRIEKFIYKHRVKEMFRVYKGLWDKGIYYMKPILYTRFMERSGFIDEIWMTNPVEYIGPRTKKKVNTISLFAGGANVKKYTRYFRVNQDDFTDLNGYLIYMSVIIRDPKQIPNEIRQIKKLQAKLGRERVLIKLHPNASQLQFDSLKEQFGEKVFRNYVPAEIYIGNATHSDIVGCASTSLFFHNPSCRYYALKLFYQELGIYSKWYNINLPPHVTQLESLEDLKEPIV